MKKFSTLFFALALGAFAFTSCNSCFDCKDCDDATFEEEFCWNDYKDEYDSKSDFEDDIDVYEAFTGCECK